MTLYTRGFSHFVTSMTAPVASGRSDSCRVGLAPTEERRLSTAHTQSGHSAGLRFPVYTPSRVIDCLVMVLARLASDAVLDAAYGWLPVEPVDGGVLPARAR